MTVFQGWRPRLVALDIDGTLVGADNAYSDAAAAAVQRAVDAGTHIVLSTGRGVLGTRPIAERLGLDKPFLVCSNGAVTARLGRGGELQVLDRVTFDASGVLYRLLERLPPQIGPVLVAVEDIGEGYRVSAPFPPGELSGRLRVAPMAELVAEPVVRVILRAPEVGPEQMLDLVDRVRLDDAAHYVGYSGWLDLAPDGVSKATALLAVATRLGVRREEVLAIGDGDNDVEMLSWAGRGVAMGNARLEVRQVADHVTAEQSAEGVAIELDRWFPAS